LKCENEDMKVLLVIM